MAITEIRKGENLMAVQEMDGEIWWVSEYNKTSTVNLRENYLAGMYLLEFNFW